MYYLIKFAPTSVEVQEIELTEKQFPYTNYELQRLQQIYKHRDIAVCTTKKEVTSMVLSRALEQAKNTEHLLASIKSTLQGLL